MIRRPVFLLFPLFFATASPCAAPQDDIQRLRIRATERMLDSEGEDALRHYAREHLAPTFRESFGDEAKLMAHLHDLRRRIAPIGGVGLDLDGAGGIRLTIHNRRTESTVRLALERAAPHRIVALELERQAPRKEGPKVTWETLDSLLERAEKAGFCGAVLAARDGEIVLDRAYGHADPASQHRNTPDTLFAIGSTPIDFTHAAILLLEQEDRLSRADTLAKYFEDAPADKRGITLEQLRTGGSGLIDFPGIEGVDDNLDLSWIDRDEFVRRVMQSELLFEPGTARRHSHCAWGVLAAVVELVSGQDYETFLRERFFAPAGMERTGHYTLSKRFAADEVAVGLGGNTYGEVNSPPHWGKTSWLVLGSGGMVSTPRDLYRWFGHLKGGKILGPEALTTFGIEGPNVGVGGNDRGFVCTIGFHGDSIAIVCSNSRTAMGDATVRLAEAVAAVAAGDR